MTEKKKDGVSHTLPDMANPGQCEGGACSFRPAPPSTAQLKGLPTHACRVIQDLTFLLGVSQALQEDPELGISMRLVLEQMKQHLGVARSFITIYNRERDELSIDQALGLREEVLQSIRYRPGEGVIGRVMESGNPHVVRDIHRCPDFLNRTNALAELTAPPEHTIAFLSVPIKLTNSVIGTINIFRQLDRNAPEHVLDPDLRILTLTAQQIAQAARLRQRSREEIEALRQENSSLHYRLNEVSRPSRIIGNASVMRQVFFEIQQAAPSDTTILIRGESGVGKELVAEAIHQQSSRATKPFHALNCAALPANLIESELFGHERGAFTGAVRERKGRFELADGGTLFLDEVGELPMAIQAKLLRVVQEGTFERIGGGKTLHVNVRLIAATNRPLEDMITAEQFRQDLYYRLNVFPIFVPPLRERKGDILTLADHFVEKYAERNHKRVLRISTPAIDMLMAYHWPGNVRELENVIERAVLLTQDSVIHGFHLPASLQTGKATSTEPTGTLSNAVEIFEREVVFEALKNTQGNMAAAARNLGLTERQIGLRVRKYDISLEQLRPPSGE